MLKILMWHVSNDTSYRDKAMIILEQQHDVVEIVGSSTSSDIAKVDGGGYNVILVVGAKKLGMSKIMQTAVKLKLDTEKLLGDWIVCIPGFTLDKYRQLQHSNLSIISMNCFGGLISHTLGLPFNSPFVNMFLSGEDFIKFLRAPQAYMAEKVIFKETAWEGRLKIHYPVVTLGDVVIHLNHYRDFDSAVKVWHERKVRINWDNLFVTAYTEDENISQEFDTLPYGKKVCFVPFKSDLNSVWQTHVKPNEKLPFWKIVNNFGKGTMLCYNPFDMLLYGKKTPLVEM